MKRILIPTDFSDEARNSIEYAVRLFGHGQHEYVLMNAYAGLHAGTRISDVELDQALKREAEGNLDHERQRIQEKFGSGVQVKTLALNYFLEKAVAESAASADVVVIGTRKRKSWLNFWQGTTGSVLIGRINRPVLVVPHDYQVDKVKHIVFATDYRMFKESDSLGILRDLAKLTKAHVHVLHIEQLDAPEMDIEKWLLDVFLRGVDHTFTTIKSEAIVPKIKAYCKEINADMVALIARRETAFEEVFNSSNADRLAMSVDIPFLAIDAKP